RRSGKSLCSTSCFVSHAAVSSSHYGHSATADRESLRRVRPGAVANRFASRNDETFLARRAARGGTCLGAGARARLAFSTFRSGARHAAADLVPRVLRCVQRISVYFSSEIRGKNNAVGNGGARGTVALLSGVSAHSRCVSERCPRSGARGICAAVAPRTFRAAQAHAARQRGAQCAAR